MEQHRTTRPAPEPAPKVTIGTRVFFYPTAANPINYSILRKGEPLTALVVYVYEDGTINLVVVDHLGRAWFEEHVHLHHTGVRREGERHCMLEYVPPPPPPPVPTTLPTGGTPTPTPLPTPSPTPLTPHQHELELEKQLEEERALERQLAQSFEQERAKQLLTEAELRLWREREEKELREELERLRLRRMRGL
jgi:hypothetical protein